MIILSTSQIKEIANHLDCGLKCYYNRKTNEIQAIPDFDNSVFVEKETWQDLIDEIDEHFEDYFLFEQMSSSGSFQVMIEFVNEVEDESFRKRLVFALNRSHPFRNFKDEIDSNSEYRERWFKFKEDKYIENIKLTILEYNQIEVLNLFEKGQA
jgi:hypothetical protein